MISFPFPRMIGMQQINIVWVDTSRDHWKDTTEARETIQEALDWWERQIDVTFSTQEYSLTVDIDILALNVCKDTITMPAVSIPTLYMIAYEPTYRSLQCDGTDVGDGGIYGQRYILMSGYLIHDAKEYQATVAHTVAHLFGAQDTHMPPRTYDLMDRDYYIDAYKQGFISDTTITAIGAVRKEQ